MSVLSDNAFVKRAVQYELNICNKFNRASHVPFVRGFFATISRLGDGIFWYALMLVLPFAYGFEAVSASIHMLIVGIIVLAIYKFIKSRTERPRPCVVDNKLSLGTAPLDQYSFPSGHTMHAASFAFVALSYYPELSVILLPFASLVALSRIILALHYPTDVICGAALGISIASLSFQVI